MEMSEKETKTQSILGDMRPSKAIVRLAVPATLALLAKAVYNLVDTAYIGMLDSDIALTAVGVTVPLLLIMVSIENIFAAGAAVLAGRQLGAKDPEGASRTITTIIGISMLIGILLCVGGIVFMEPLMRAFGASDASLPLAEDYAFWMFVAALANLPAQSMNCAARAESSVRISSIAVITGALLNIAMDPVFMFSWGLNMGVAGASLATTVSQFVTFFILVWFYASGRSIIKIRVRAFRPSWDLMKTVTLIGIPTAVIQICLSVASSLTNIAAASLPQSDEIIAAYGVVQRLVLIGCYVVMGFMQGYQPVASYAFGARDEDRFHQKGPPSGGPFSAFFLLPINKESVPVLPHTALPRQQPGRLQGRQCPDAVEVHVGMVQRLQGVVGLLGLPQRCHGLLPQQPGHTALEPDPGTVLRLGHGVQPQAAVRLAGPLHAGVGRDKGQPQSGDQQVFQTVRLLRRRTGHRVPAPLRRRLPQIFQRTSRQTAAVRQLVDPGT